MTTEGGSEISDKYRWYFIEYDPRSARGRMPQMFNSVFYDKVPGRVMLCDRYNNEVEVRVHRKNGKVFLTDGWRQVGRLYNLHEGGWLKVFYFSKTEFILDTVLCRWKVEVQYPQPEKTFRLGEASSPIEIDVEDEGEINGCDQFLYSFEKKLNANQVTASSLLLPAAFCSLALEKGQTTCYLVDEGGISWSCKLRWAARSSNECYLTAGWLNFARNKGLKEGTVIRLGVANNKPTSIHVFIVS